MREILLTKVTAVVLLTLGVGLAWAVSAPAARGAAPESRFTLSVDRHVVRSGASLTASASAPTQCTWLLEWVGERRVDHAHDVVTNFVAPAVTRPTRVALRATCFYRGPEPTNRPGTGTLVAFVPPSWTQTELVTVLPAGAAVSAPAGSPSGGGGGSGLPQTGGPLLLVLLAAMGSLVVGAALVRRGSRAVPA